MRDVPHAAPTHSRAAHRPPMLTTAPDRPLVRVLLGALAGALLAAGYALHPVWWAPWLAPAVLLAAGGRDGESARLTGRVAGLVAITTVLPYYVAQNGWVVTVLIALLRVGSWEFVAWIAARAARRVPLGVAVLALPGAAAALELLTLTLSPHGAAGSLAYSQMDVPAVVQVAAVGGVPAVVFLLLLPGSLAGLWFARAWPVTERRVAAGAVAVAGVAAALFATARFHVASAGSRVPVALVATNQFDGVPKDWASVWAVYRPAVLRAGPRGGLVVLPEKLARLDAGAALGGAADMAAAAQATGATVVAGLEVHDARGYRNRAVVATPEGRLAWYTKQRLVPGWEARDTPGATPLVVATAGTRVGVAICKDLHIPAIGRAYGVSPAAALLAVPAWDFGRDGWLGARMSALRAVESGYAVARSARDGLVGAYDAAGRPVVERVADTGVTVVTATLPVGGRATPYATVGEAFGWTCVAGTALLTAWLVVDARGADARGVGARGWRRTGGHPDA